MEKIYMESSNLELLGMNRYDIVKKFNIYILEHLVLWGPCLQITIFNF